MGALCIFLLIACGFDYRKSRIPNYLLLTMLAAGICRSGFGQGAEGVIAFGTRALLMILCMYPFFKIGTLGAGDVKLFGVCAGYLPGGKVLYFLFFSLLIAAGISLIKLVREHNAKERLVYLGEYFLDVARSGSWQLYLPDKDAQKHNGICLAGPIFCSVLMYVGGIY